MAKSIRINSETRELRRLWVSRLRLRQNSLEEISVQLTKITIDGLQPLRNPNKPNGRWALSTISTDLKLARERWKNETHVDVDELMSEQLATINEGLRAAFAVNDLTNVHRFLIERAKFFGIDAPQRIEHSGSINSTQLEIPVTELSDDQLATLIEVVNGRHNNQSPVESESTSC